MCRSHRWLKNHYICYKWWLLTWLLHTCKWKREFSDTNLRYEENLLTFKVKVKKVHNKMLYPYTKVTCQLEVKCWWRLPLPSQSPHQCGPATQQLQSSVLVEAHLCRCCIGPGDMGNCCWRSQCWRRPCTSRWHLQRSAATRTDGWSFLVAGSHWWGITHWEQGIKLGSSTWTAFIRRQRWTPLLLHKSFEEWQLNQSEKQTQPSYTIQNS